jgi:hypothetical protein
MEVNNEGEDDSYVPAPSKGKSSKTLDKTVTEITSVKSSIKKPMPKN